MVNNLKTLSRHPFLMEASDAVRRRAGKDVLGDDLPGGDVDDVIDGLGALSLGAAPSSSSSSSSSSSTAAKVRADATVFEIAGRAPDPEDLLRDSIKLRVLLRLSQRLKRAGHRILVFSQSRLMLDIMQRMYAEYGMPTSRIDGTVTGKDRQTTIDRFNRGAETDDAMAPAVLLLTTKVSA